MYFNAKSKIWLELTSYGNNSCWVYLLLNITTKLKIFLRDEQIYVFISRVNVVYKFSVLKRKRKRKRKTKRELRIHETRLIRFINTIMVFSDDKKKNEK